jgi:hypothetical protein
MIRRGALIALWLLLGAAAIGGLFWAFLNTPESNALMLALSALLLLAMVVECALVVNAAVLLANGDGFAASVAGGARRIHWFLVAAIPAALLIWAVLRGDAWVARHSGEINAWFIARFGWSDVSALFRAQEYLSVWIRWVLLPVTALAALAAMLRAGSAAPRLWLRTAWHWRPLLIATVAFVVLIALPWRAAFWRPQNLPATWVEPAFAGVRLALIAITAAIGASVMLVAASDRTPRSTGSA